MANVKVYNMSGAEVGSMELADSVFAVEVNTAVLHAAVRAYLLNQRQGTQSTLTRTEVSGGGKKPWRQKGTGHHPLSPVDTRPRSARTDAQKLQNRPP